MDENRMRQRIVSAVDQRCSALKPDPLLAQRVMRMAEEKGDRKVKRKLSYTLVLAIVLVLLSLTALAAALLSGMEIVDQQAVPVAQGNDGGVRVNRAYSHEELMAILAVAEENGISLEDDYFIMEAVARGEGYDEEEVIMAICREAFGGLFYEWNVEQQHWFGEKMVEIGFSDANPYRLPGEGQLPPEEARALAVTLLQAEFPGAPVDDPGQYRTVEDFDDGGWYFTFYPRNLTNPEYHIHFSHDVNVVETHCTPQEWDTYSEAQLMEAINTTYGYRTHTQQSWNLEAWHVFSQLLPGATRTTAWSAEYDGYLATAYLLPGEGDISAEEAKAIAMADAEIDLAIHADTLLLGKEDNRIWKVTLRFLNSEGDTETLMWEINAATGKVLHRMNVATGMFPWASFVLYETYVEANSDAFTPEAAMAIAVPALREYLGDDTIPFDDPAVYASFFRPGSDGTFYTINFNPTSMEYGRCAIQVRCTGEAKIQYANAPGLTADNLFSRMSYTYSSGLTWDQSLWVEFDRMLDTLGEPTTFEGKLFAATSYPDASAVRLTLDDALDAVQLDLGTRAEDPVSWVLIAADPHPVWKIRMGTFPANTLYEVDAMTGEIVDRELYVCQNDAFDHDMKMFTLRSTYMPAALAEFGPVRIAMELTVKSDFSAFDTDETIFMDKNCYAVSVDGMTVTFTALRDNLPSYRTTILDGGLDAVIEYIPPVAPPTEAPDPARVNG